MPQFVDGHPRMRPECVTIELARRNRPASLLRWDLPTAIFNAGRCTIPAHNEKTRFPIVASKMTDDGYYPWGFTGHEVVQTGVGWIFHPVAKRKRGGGFGHDAWTFNYKLSGTKNNARMADRLPLEPCRVARGKATHTSSAYATARLAARSASRGYDPGSPQQIAAAFKWEFANSTMNCYWPPADWERALEDQRTYAMLLARKKHILAEECSIWGSLYNQMHLSWNRSDLAAIFFVNDTLTAWKGPRPRVARARRAQAAAQRAFEDAVAAQRAVATLVGQVVPVVQYRVAEDECADGQPLARRLRQAATATEKSGLHASKSRFQPASLVDVPVVFHAPG